MITTLISAGILSALIAGLISFRLQSNFFIEQEKRLKEKEKQDDLKKVNFLKSAFLSEAKYNIMLIEKAEKEKHRLVEQFFDTQCYTLFKENIALLDIDIPEKINRLYLELFQANSRIKELNYKKFNYESIKPIYLEQKTHLLQFINSLDTNKEIFKI